MFSDCPAILRPEETATRNASACRIGGEVANGTPPVNAFWSITMYNSRNFLVNNSLDRYAIAQHLGNLTYNADGSLDIYVQNASPGLDKEANWLPAPSDEFHLVMRLYWPQEAVLNGSWVPPAVQQVG